MHLTQRRQSAGGGGRDGFTLIELMVVMAIIAIIVAAAMPQFLPILIYSTHEGAARHLANYGRSVIAHATLDKETITVMIDLDNQEYWCERWPDPEPEELEEEGFVDQDDGLPEDDMELYRLAQEELQLPENERGSEEGEDLLNEQTSRMVKQFNMRSRQALSARAKRVVHDQQGILQGMGDLFEEDFHLDKHGEEILPEEVADPLLGRTRVPQGVYIEYVQLGDVQHIEGIVEIELTPLGLGSDVEFSLVNEDGDVFIVKWDPVSGGATLTEGGTT
ncbi:MAG: prepilin-type N-terminal cleavage/methylation domain-containing protein [Candidatus Hydrogenedentes bacterium]|nr:prepilin-type N-terminal cleavage/methylation domain-containing protein [Candidatus Hydrogenedentota bacterium]